MIALVPNWAHHYDEFWSAIKNRNLWFIKIRYFFVAALVLFIVLGEFLLSFELTPEQIIAISLLSVIILFYNIIIHSFRKKVGCVPGRFNCLHLSLLQMILDLTSLMILIYYTGIIESPFHLFAIIQTIIGSLILPGYIVYGVVGVFLTIFTLFVFLQHFELIATHCIPGLCDAQQAHNLSYVITILLVFASVILISIYIANNIAHQLYNREQQLRTSLEKIEQVEDKKQKYIIGVVHEIKTPISAIQSLANVLLENYIAPLPEKVKEKIDRIKIRSSDALTLVNNVLYISRLKLLDLTSTEKIDIEPIVKGIIEKRCGDIKSKEVNVELNDKRQHRKLIEADKLLLEVALSNVICNSFKYTPSGGKIQIDITDNLDDLRIEIADTGIGIPENELQNIFNEFYRASNVKKTDLEGSGLGLALVKEVIDRHRGRVKIQSPSKLGTVENPGTAVIITLPYNSPIENPSTKKMTTES